MPEPIMGGCGGASTCAGEAPPESAPAAICRRRRRKKGRKKFPSRGATVERPPDCAAHQLGPKVQYDCHCEFLKHKSTYFVCIARILACSRALNNALQGPCMGKA